MKKVIKLIKNNTLLGIIIGGIIFGSIGVGAAAYLYSSNQISYSNSNSSMTNVKEALDDLYNLTNIGNATSADIYAGKTALVQGKLVTGTSQSVTSFSGQIYAVRHNLNSGLTGKINMYDLPPCTLKIDFAKGNTSSNFSLIISNNGVQINSGSSGGTFELNDDENDLYIYTWQNVSSGTSDFTINYTITLK